MSFCLSGHRLLNAILLKYLLFYFISCLDAQLYVILESKELCNLGVCNPRFDHFM